MSKEVNQEEYAPRTIADVKEMLSKHSNGEIQRTIRNCELILQNDHVLANAIRLNLLSERIDIVKPVGWPRSGKALIDTDMKYILRRMEKYGISSEKKIESAIRIVANENRYHPIRDYLNSLKWDGTERIAHVLHHFLGAAEDDYTCEAMKIFLLGAIKRVFQPGCKFETMLCLVGGQGAGKSSFFRLLAVKDEWFSDDLRRLEHALNGSQQEDFHGFASVLVLRSTEEVVQDVGNPFVPIPLQAVQVIPDGMIAVLVGNDVDGGFDLLLAGNTVFLHSPQDILHVGVVQGLAGAGPAYGLHNVDALTQQVQPDGIGKHMVILQNRDAVLNRSLNFAVGMFGQHFLHVCNGSGAAFFLIDFFAQ